MIKRILLESNKRDLKILTSKCEHVSVNEEDKFFLVKGKIQDMKDTLANEETGVGLAANQIGIQARVIVTKHGNKLQAFINPCIVYGFGNVTSKEGCLSRPGKSEKVVRYKTIRLQWTNEIGETKTREFTKKHAIIIQHEIDHLNGVLI